MGFNQDIHIGDFKIGIGHSTFIIAEAGVNHNGDMDLAKKLIDVAASSGVNAVKFQSFKPEELILKTVEKAAYQKETTGNSESQYEMLQKLRLDIDQTLGLQKYADRKGIVFMTTPFDEVSLEELDVLNLPAYKISSTDFTNIGFIEKVMGKGKPVVISCAMSYLKEIQFILEKIEPLNPNVILLHCTANYPTPEDEVNLNVLETLTSEFNMLVGYSDHTPGIGASPYAVALGAHVIEKHFTLDKTMSGPDHEASLDPGELHAFVKEIRKVETMMGSFEKAPTPSEKNTREKLQKCFVASRPINKGELFSQSNIIARRTGGQGLSAIRLYDLIGMKSNKDFGANEIISIDE